MNWASRSGRHIRTLLETRFKPMKDRPIFQNNGTDPPFVDGGQCIYQIQKQIHISCVTQFAWQVSSRTGWPVADTLDSPSFFLWCPCRWHMFFEFFFPHPLSKYEAMFYMSSGVGDAVSCWMWGSSILTVTMTISRTSWVELPDAIHNYYTYLPVTWFCVHSTAWGACSKSLRV